MSELAFYQITPYSKLETGIEIDLKHGFVSDFQVQKRRRLNALNTVVSLLREQIKIPSMIGSATTVSSTTQPQAKSAPEATLLTAASVEGTKVFLCTSIT